MGKGLLKRTILMAMFLILSYTLAVSEELSTGPLMFNDEPAIPGRLEATGTHFEIKDSEYINIVVGSSEPIKLILESFPEMVTMHLESATNALSTRITLDGLAPQTTYHKYEDNYHNHETFTTDDKGNYSYIQDLSKPHIIFIQPKPSTKFIRDDATGGDCTSIGIWDSFTKTCTLTTDINETVQIDSDNITLDGNGRMISSYLGVYLYERMGVIIRNLNIWGVYGLYLYKSNSNILTNNILPRRDSYIFLSQSNDNTLTSNTAGIQLDYSTGNILTDNIAKNRAARGIALRYSRGNTLTNNIAGLNESNGIILFYSNNNTLIGNTANSRWRSGIVLSASNSNILVGNNASDSNWEFGVYLVSSSNNVLAGNIISFNLSGLVVRNDSNNNTISDNTISSQRDRGVDLSGVFGNTLTGNTISNNDEGIGLHGSSGNRIYNNNFINNYLFQARSSGNIFNLEAPIGGNYWSDYDTASEGCSDLNGDNFCDAPYIIGYDQDNLPWTRPDGWKTRDDVPPTTTIELSGIPGNNGWYLSDVQVTLTATDNEGGSGVAKTEYSFNGTDWDSFIVPFTVYVEGTTTVYCRSMDNAGNVETTRVQTISIDKTPPTITGATMTSPNIYGWYSTDGVVHFTASDNISGIDSGTPDITMSMEGANQSATGTAVDKAGNSASTTISGINIDKTAPVITITSPMAAKYDHFATINISFTAIDDVSGVYKTTVYLDGQQYDSTGPIDIFYLPLGIHTLKVESGNYAGLTATQSVDFEVIATAGGTTSLVTRLCQMGAIDNAGIANSLIQKLEAAQAAISSNQTVSAQNILAAFINMLEAQSGKHITTFAVDLLKADALYMIGQL